MPEPKPSPHRTVPHHKPEIKKTEPVIIVPQDIPGLSLEAMLANDSKESAHHSQKHTSTAQHGTAIKPGQKIQFD